MRWLLLDEVLSIQKSFLAKTRSHIPQTKVSPEVLMIEMMAQTGALLLGAESDFKEDLVFAKIEEARFECPLRPGEMLQIEADSDNLRSEGAWLNGRIQSDRGIIAKARFLLMNVGHLIAGRAQPITFHPVFMSYFRIRDKVRVY